MTMLLRTGLLILFVFLLPACGSSDSASSSTSDNRSNQAQPDSGSDETDPGSDPDIVNPPVAADLTTNVFFPVVDGLALYYDDDTTPAVLGEPDVSTDPQVYPLLHADERIEYITSTTYEVGLSGVYLLMIQSETPVYLDLDFVDVRPILGNGTSYVSGGDAKVKITGLGGPYTIPVTLTAKLNANELLPLPGFSVAQPARKIRLDMRLTVDIVTRLAILFAYPWAEPFLDSIILDLWFVPGVGIAKIQQGEWNTTLDHVTGTDEPLVFSYLRYASPASIDTRQLTYRGEVLTDPDWQRTIYYRTAGVDWLDVSYDETGSWGASITNTSLARGVYAATVRFTKGEQVQDVTVSMMVR